MDEPLVRPYSSESQLHVLKTRANSTFEKERPRNVEGSDAPPVHIPKPRSKSTLGAPGRSKWRQSSFSLNGGQKPLNTHSPVAVAAAAAVTPDKIRKLLVAHGPLPIRHITAHLASTIHGFGELSLSKQRRLIIGVLDNPHSEFIKVGWGRWAVHGEDMDNTLVESGQPVPTAESSSESVSGSANLPGSARSASSASAIHPGTRMALKMLRSGSHRESIVSSLIPSAKPPLSPSLRPVDDNAVFSDSEESSDSEIENTDEEDWRAIGPDQLRHTSPREQEAIAALVQLRSI